MLIRFGCSNYKSISEYQELLLTASSLKDDQSDLIIPESFNEPLLSGLALYGANASGKTNVLLGLREMLYFISSSHKRQDTKGINRQIFRLDEKFKNCVTEFDIDFICDDVHYHYGYKYNDEYIVEEWLFSYSYGKKKSRKVLFHRNSENEEQFYFGKALRGKKRVVAELTRPNSLFLSSAAQNNHKNLASIYEFLELRFKFRFENQINEYSISEKMENVENKEKVISFLKNMDIGIKEIKVHRVKELEDLGIFKSFQKLLLEEMEIDKPEAALAVKELMENRKELSLFHESVSGDLVEFGLDEESLGTRSLIALLIPVFEVLGNGGTFIVDELESSLHALLTLQILALFSDKATNRNGAQIIFSTHETNVLCSDLLRRDQIWFSEKGVSGNTVLTPLTDFSLRKDFDIQSGYLEGRFGAIPFYGSLKQLFST